MYALWPPRIVTSSGRSPQGRSAKTYFYRLNVVPIALPALRERRTDVPHLCRYFITKFNARLKKNIEWVEPDALDRLTAYSWPGNIRELENVIERAVLFADSPRIRLEDFGRRAARFHGRWRWEAHGSKACS